MGELFLLQSEDAFEAENCFNESLAVAKSKNAKFWELRTAISLARLWQKQGKTSEARELLAGMYRWFTEGFGTPDVVDAKVLIEELA